MANIKSFPNNQNEYAGAEEAMRWLHGRTSGVFGAADNAAVAPVLDTMAVTVSDGNGWLSNNEGNGIVWWNSNEKDTGSKLQLQVDLAHALLTRIDRVVVSWETTDYEALPTITILKGTPATYAVPPVLTNNNVMRQISLAKITIPAGAVVITSAMITDERLDPSVCGLVTSEVGIDTSVMQAQFVDMLTSIADQLERLTLGTEAMLKTTYDRNADGLVDREAVDGLSEAFDAAATAQATANTVANAAMPKSGGIFTGAVTLNGSPTEDLHAATKLYVDEHIKPLWTNASPTSNFGAQTISLDLSGYKLVLIGWKAQKTHGAAIWNICKVGSGNVLINPNNIVEGKAVGRSIQVSATGVTFYNVDGNTAGTYDYMYIPTEIYGVR